MIVGLPGHAKLAILLWQSVAADQPPVTHN